MRSLCTEMSAISDPSSTLLEGPLASGIPTRALWHRDADIGAPPWKWHWTRWRVGEGWTFFWILWIHAWAIAGLALFPLPGWGVFGVTALLMWMGGMGTTVCYHRALAHKALKLHPVVEFVLTVFCIFNGSGTPATWTANHRLHHNKADTAEDISSPRIGGFWWSHFRWLYQAGQIPLDKWAPDLNTVYYRWYKNQQVKILAGSFLIGLALVPFLGWAAFFWIGPMRLAYSLNAQCFVNSIAHMKKGVKEGEDSSVNLVWLGFVQTFQGENWHGNHHANPSSARLGWTPAQVDFGWYAIWTLEKLGLATSVRRPRHSGS